MHCQLLVQFNKKYELQKVRILYCETKTIHNSILTLHVSHSLFFFELVKIAHANKLLKVEDDCLPLLRTKSKCSKLEYVVSTRLILKHLISSVVSLLPAELLLVLFHDVLI